MIILSNHGILQSQQATISPTETFLIGGQFGAWGDNTKRGLARINSDGSLDTSFNAAFGMNTLPTVVYGNTVAKDSAGNYYVVGAFTAQAGNILQAAECIDYFINEMNIVFYSHRVSYPNVLSAQVLPQELKDLAIERLTSVEQRLEFETLEDVFKEDVQAIEKQKGPYFPLMKAMNRYEDHCVHFGKWFKENLENTKFNNSSSV